MKSRRHSIGACAALAMTLSAGCEFTFQISLLLGRAERDFEVSTAFEDVGTLDVDWIGGEVTIRIDESATDITATGVLTASASDDDEAEAALDEVEVLFAVAESFPLQVFLSVETPDDFNAAVVGDVEVVIPGGLTIEVVNSSGDVTVEANQGSTNVDLINGRVVIVEQSGDTVIEVTNGSIEIDSVAGGVDVQSLNGSIDVSAQPMEGESVIAETTNGSVSIFLPTDTNADLELRTINGVLSFDLQAFTVTNLEVFFNRLTATLNDGGIEVSGETINGSVSFGPIE